MKRSIDKKNIPMARQILQEVLVYDCIECKTTADVSKNPVSELKVVTKAIGNITSILMIVGYTRGESNMRALRQNDNPFIWRIATGPTASYGHKFSKASYSNSVFLAAPKHVIHSTTTQRQERNFT